MQPRKLGSTTFSRVRRAPDITYDTVLLAGGDSWLTSTVVSTALKISRLTYEGEKMIVPAANEALAETQLKQLTSVS